LECFSYQKDWDQEGIKQGSKQHPKSTLMLLSPVNIIGAFSFVVKGIPGSHFFNGSKKTDLKSWEMGTKSVGLMSSLMT